MAKVLGIGGVFLKADDPERLLTWYEQNLGVKRTFPGGVIFPWRQADSPEKQGMTVWSLFSKDTPYFGPGKQTVMVNYMVDDLEGMLQALRDAGAQVEDRREESEYGKFGWATDPEGNRIELWQPPS